LTAATVHVGVRALTVVTNRHSDFDILRDVSGDFRIQDIPLYTPFCNLKGFIGSNSENVEFIPLS
jgi:hypothetical protein